MKEIIENVSYGKAVKKYRIKNHMTQEQLAQATNLETKYISQIECGVSKGSLNTMINLCRAFDITPNELLSVDLCQVFRHIFLRIYINYSSSAGGVDKNI